MHKLPDKPSELIRLALTDLAKVEADPEHYTVDMSKWHAPSWQHRCLVCFGGAVIAGTFDVSPRAHVYPNEFGDDAMHKLHALDLFRTGCIMQALSEMGIRHRKGTLPDRIECVSLYSDSAEGFRHDMTMIADMLEKEGL